MFNLLAEPLFVDDYRLEISSDIFLTVAQQFGVLVSDPGPENLSYDPEFVQSYMLIGGSQYRMRTYGKIVLYLTQHPCRFCPLLYV